jgi:23S rRNA pseudouridine1911/1915/1917 synthase
LKILFEDDDMIVINKDPGISVHPTVGNFRHTLVNYALHHCKDLSGIAGELRPGVVHRLDKPTSGIIVMAKNDLAHEGLAIQFKERLTEKYYYAIVKNPMEFSEGYVRKSIIRDPRDRQRMAATDDLTKGKSALTTYEVAENYPTASLLRIRIHTGRTHQIRVHFSSIGHPLIGDTLYQRRLRPVDRYGLALCSKELRIRHPRTGQEMYFTAPFPPHFDQIIRLLKKNDPRELVEEDYDTRIEEGQAEEEADEAEDVN